MNTPMLRRSARIANRSAMATPVPVKTQQWLCNDHDSVGIRRSRRLALRKQPNYYESEEWEVEDPIYTSNTEIRTYIDLSVEESAKCKEDAARVKIVMDRAEDKSLPFSGRNRAVIDTLYWIRKSMYMIPMYPTLRATVREKIREFEADIANGKTNQWSAFYLNHLLDEMGLLKEALVNAHRSPYYVAAAGA